MTCQYGQNRNRKKSKILQNTTTTLWHANMARIETEKNKI